MKNEYLRALSAERRSQTHRRLVPRRLEALSWLEEEYDPADVRSGGLSESLASVTPRKSEEKSGSPRRASLASCMSSLRGLRSIECSGGATFVEETVYEATSAALTASSEEEAAGTAASRSASTDVKGSRIFGVRKLSEGISIYR